GWNLILPGVVPEFNPCKGIVPFKGDFERFPYSLEYCNFPVDGVANETGFDFGIMDSALDEVTGRGHQLIFRLYLDYPGYDNAVPQYLIDDGLEMHEYSDYGGGYSPDYDDPRLVDLMINLIDALGIMFDDDPRIAFIQVGLLGFWGEWHTHPHPDWFANETTQNVVLKAYDRAFNKTKLMVRKPTPVTVNYNIGFHIDGFVSDTICPDPWCFYSLLERYDPNRWKSEPIGGEIFPVLQASVFESITGEHNIIDCVDKTHASWLLIDTLFRDAFSDNYTDLEITHARGIARRLGYTFTICYSKIELDRDSNKLTCMALVGNFGVAPFYYNWTVSMGLMVNDTVVASYNSTNNVGFIEPGEHRIWDFEVVDAPVKGNSEIKIALKVPAPFNQSTFIRFANAGQRDDGWVIIGSLSYSQGMNAD
ncbi:MAG: DUF4832 domain-containing protein, partial [Promethearchaeota archaeon]